MQTKPEDICFVLSYKILKEFIQEDPKLSKQDVQDNTYLKAFDLGFFLRYSHVVL